MVTLTSVYSQALWLRHQFHQSRCLVYAIKTGGRQAGRPTSRKDDDSQRGTRLVSKYSRGAPEKWVKREHLRRNVIVELFFQLNAVSARRSNDVDMNGPP